MMTKAMFFTMNVRSTGFGHYTPLWLLKKSSKSLISVYSVCTDTNVSVDWIKTVISSLVNKIGDLLHLAYWALSLPCAVGQAVLKPVW